MDLETLYKTYQPFLFSIAYRMLGSVTDAEDIVHDLFLELKIDTSQVKNLQAYLAKMVTNRCLNFLNSPRHRREIYTGPWLPEPNIGSTQQPLNKIIKEETVSYAFLVLMERLSSLERAVFVLREAFSYNYKDIAEVLEKSEANCRKIYSRAKQKLKNDLPVHLQNTEQVVSLTKSFIEASKTGDVEEFIDVLSEDVVLVTDGGGKVPSALYPIVNKHRVLAFLKGVINKTGIIGELLPVVVNGQKGILQVKDGHPLRVVCFELDPNQKKYRESILFQTQTS
ncbi:RNA polymerase sigma-70 factor [Virgibacillus salidurans]|uniref:RNA polymerase sigma-70 factor n=1 Tax=Virgibacillus salidurans TaxID=2831673 RepID=UPI001F27C453|nr:RNA polymerase sigma-70 factor [Virgibacillus sp. NKC19-16]